MLQCSHDKHVCQSLREPTVLVACFCSLQVVCAHSLPTTMFVKETNDRFGCFDYSHAICHRMCGIWNYEHQKSEHLFSKGSPRSSKELLGGTRAPKGSTPASPRTTLLATTFLGIVEVLPSAEELATTGRGLSSTLRSETKGNSPVKACGYTVMLSRSNDGSSLCDWQSSKTAMPGKGR